MALTSFWPSAGRHELDAHRLAARAGRCAVNGEAAHAGRRLRRGPVEVEASEGAPNSMTPERTPLEIVHEDEHLIVVVKPAGVLVHPTLGVKSGTLANALAYHLNRELIDESDAFINQTPASGRAAVRSAGARPPARPRHVGAPRRHEDAGRAQPSLTALPAPPRREALRGGCRGRRRDERLTIAAPIGRTSQRAALGRSEGGRPRRVCACRRGARGARSSSSSPGRGAPTSCAYTAARGAPGRRRQLYGGEPQTRLCLHAARLSFRHPATNEPVEFISEAPPELLSALA